LALGERTVTRNWFELAVNDVLSQGGIAANMPFRLLMQNEQRHLTEDVSEIEVRFREILDVAAANLAEIALIASRHRGASDGGHNRSGSRDL
jgi:hypothetical protein